MHPLLVNTDLQEPRPFAKPSGRATRAVALIREKECQLCGRLFRRADGTVVTGDCPIGLRAIARRTRRVVAACLAAAFALLVLRSAMARGANRPRNAALAEVSQWVDDVLVWMGVRTDPMEVVGVVFCIDESEAPSAPLEDVPLVIPEGGVVE